MSYRPSLAYGPWLRYQDLNLSTKVWTGSVLVVSLGPQPPSLSFNHAGQQFSPQPFCLDTFQSYNFWRWQLDLQLIPQESQVAYSVYTEWSQGQAFQKSFSFCLPGASQCWHWGFHSCNGFSHGVDASWEIAGTALWRDVLGLHRRTPIHCMVGGGDQLYQDGFFHEPAVIAWLKIKDRKIREAAPVTADIDAQISHFMFHHYCHWFSKDDMREAFACIPQVMIWDDHDLMDGWGSYPDQLQNCPIFQHAYKIGRRFYLAFQQHTNLALAHQQANLFGRGESYSLIRLMGSNVALVAPDVRAERTRSQVVSPESWQMIFDRVAALPGSVRHIVLLTTIPVVYPKIPLSEKAMGVLSTLGRTHAVDAVLNKTGLWNVVKGKAVSNFEEPELLDDLLDHWTSDFHSKERGRLISRLQGVAQSKSVRVTFVSGDVHVGGLGRLYSSQKLDLRQDFRYMPQVVSSAIMNAPPPAGVVTVLHTCSNAHMSGIDKMTKEKMVRLFKADYPKTDKLLPKRNWATFRELPPGTAVQLTGLNPKDPYPQPGDLLVTLRVEPDHKQHHLPVKEYLIAVPTLLASASSSGEYSSPGNFSQQYPMYGNSQSQGVGSASAPYRPNTQAYNQYSPPAQYQTAFASANESPAAQNYPQAGGTQNYSQPGADHSYSAPGGFPVHQQAGGSQVNYSAPQQMTYQSSAYPSNPGSALADNFGGMSINAPHPSQQQYAAYQHNLQQPQPNQLYPAINNHQTGPSYY